MQQLVRGRLVEGRGHVGRGVELAAGRLGEAVQGQVDPQALGPGGQHGVELLEAVHPVHLREALPVVGWGWGWGWGWLVGGSRWG